MMMFRYQSDLGLMAVLDSGSVGWKLVQNLEGVVLKGVRNLFSIAISKKTVTSKGLDDEVWFYKHLKFLY